MTTPVKKPHGRRPQTSEDWKFPENSDPTPSRKPVTMTPTSEAWMFSENCDPNLLVSTPRRVMKSPAMKLVNSKKKPTPKTPGRTLSSASPAQDRKPVNAKKNSIKRGKDLESKKGCRVLCESPCAPEKMFITKDQMIGACVVVEASPVEADGSKECIEKKNWVTESKEPLEGSGRSVVEVSGGQDSRGSSKMRKMRSKILQEATSSMPEPGAGRVMYLVKAFERLLSLSKDAQGREKVENKKKVMNWALPGLQQPPKAKETEVSSSPGSSSSNFITGKCFERDSGDYSSVDSSNDDSRLSWGSSTSDGGRRSGRNSTGSSGRSWNKKLKVTSQQPFKLRTEQRGRLKEEHFLKKLKEILLEEEKQRIPIAQGLPWTTDEPECLLKPPTKEPTEPIDLILHSDMRAVERAEFDLQVVEHLNFLEQIRMEKERQQKLEEEEEIRRLRKELKPRAQPMPYFDRPFIPKKSTKPNTVPKEPKFHTRPLSLRSCASILGKRLEERMCHANIFVSDSPVIVGELVSDVQAARDLVVGTLCSPEPFSVINFLTFGIMYLFELLFLHTISLRWHP
ncbi:uncharacterized protein LOC103695654 isoform X2 [Phoenix dactylifera]|uniref:Uncharacterized protein LOC103695654 isoform X2 n=1 Tax=Phoenix dactylifera TaxID=42345 RepID=A0A8B8ZRZ9_PHODC|nr:uncharacterized protein LOC103695654 isoform X2 [Phoenix dactylifera]